MIKTVEDAIPHSMAQCHERLLKKSEWTGPKTSKTDIISSTDDLRIRFEISEKKFFSILKPFEDYPTQSIALCSHIISIIQSF